MQLVIQLVDTPIDYLFWKAKTGAILFLNCLFLRLSHFCCQVIYFTFYLLSRSYVGFFIAI